jgi:hypothetical protein
LKTKKSITNNGITDFTDLDFDAVREGHPEDVKVLNGICRFLRERFGCLAGILSQRVIEKSVREELFE